MVNDAEEILRCFAPSLSRGRPGWGWGFDCNDAFYVLEGKGIGDRNAGQNKDAGAAVLSSVTWFTICPWRWFTHFPDVIPNGGRNFAVLNPHLGSAAAARKAAEKAGRVV
jgi:hypothetical protein